MITENRISWTRQQEQKIRFYAQMDASILNGIFLINMIATDS